MGRGAAASVRDAGYTHRIFRQGGRAVATGQGAGDCLARAAMPGGRQPCECRYPTSTSQQLQASSYKLAATSQQLQAGSYKLAATSWQLQASSYKPAATSQQLQASSYKLAATSWQAYTSRHKQAANSQPSVACCVRPQASSHRPAAARRHRQFSSCKLKADPEDAGRSQSGTGWGPFPETGAPHPVVPATVASRPRPSGVFRTPNGLYYIYYISKDIYIII